MAMINEKYPHGLTEKEIQHSISEYTQELVNARADINAVMLWSPLIQLGQNELQGRHTKKATNISVGASLLSIGIAVVALYIAVNSSRANARWESEQLSALEGIRIEIGTTDVNLTNSIESELSEIKNLLTDFTAANDEI